MNKSYYDFGTISTQRLMFNLEPSSISEIRLDQSINTGILLLDVYTIGPLEINGFTVPQIIARHNISESNVFLPLYSERDYKIIFNYILAIYCSGMSLSIGIPMRFSFRSIDRGKIHTSLNFSCHSINLLYNLLNHPSFYSFPADPILPALTYSKVDI